MTSPQRISNLGGIAILTGQPHSGMVGLRHNWAGIFSAVGPTA